LEWRFDLKKDFSCFTVLQTFGLYNVIDRNVILACVSHVGASTLVITKEWVSCVCPTLTLAIITSYLLFKIQGEISIYLMERFIFNVRMFIVINTHLHIIITRRTDYRIIYVIIHNTHYYMHLFRGYNIS